VLQRAGEGRGEACDQIGSTCAAQELLDVEGLGWLAALQKGLQLRRELGRDLARLAARDALGQRLERRASGLLAVDPAWCSTVARNSLRFMSGVPA
jgi:hypothetical protein